MVNKPKVLVILGPTATGKSDLAVTLAKKFNGEIVSADSRQVYKGMNLGSGKITRREMHGVKHHMLDVVSPKKSYSVAQYQIEATKAVADILARKKLPIIVGGTGFYIDAVISGVVLPEVPPNQELRAKLEKQSVETLFKKLKMLSPRRAKTIDAKNKVRLIRAIEIATALGDVPEIKQSASPYNTLFVGLDTKDEILKKKIALRLKKRLQVGMIHEVQRLHVGGVSWKRLESFGLEYRYVSQYLQKKVSRVEMEQKLNAEIWQYVKRQRTWFKRNKKIKWFELKKNSTIQEAVRDFIK